MRDERRAMKVALALIALALGVSARVGVWTESAHAARQEKTLGQTGKNIKVLTDLPESQVNLVMNFMSASLDVRCDYCHVREGEDKWDWASDAKPAKLTGRRMMQMQIEINRGNRDILGTSGTAVTCFTCHRGQLKPANSPTLPINVTQATFDAGTKKPATPAASARHKIGNNPSGSVSTTCSPTRAGEVATTVAPRAASPVDLSRIRPRTLPTVADDCA